MRETKKYFIVSKKEYKAINANNLFKTTALKEVNKDGTEKKNAKYKFIKIK